MTSRKQLVICQNNYLALLLTFKIRNLEFGIICLNTPKFYATQINLNFNTINTAYLVILEDSRLLRSLQPNFNTLQLSIVFFTEHVAADIHCSKIRCVWHVNVWEQFLKCTELNSGKIPSQTFLYSWKNCHFTLALEMPLSVLNRFDVILTVHRR